MRNTADGAHFAGSPSQAGEEIAPADLKGAPGTPSWSRVLATTFSLWASRRLPGPRRPRALLLVICVLAIGAAAVGVVRLTSTSSRTQMSSPARPHPRGSAGAAGSAEAAARVAASVRSQAAAWIAGQVGSDDTIGCDRLMCAALSAHGVAPSRLRPLGAASSAPDADVIAGSAAPGAGLGQDARTLLASFGSGGSLIEIRATSPGGPASYQAALAADAAARRSAGAQLLHSQRIEFGAQGAAQIQAGQVDSRLLIMLAMLASQRSWQVIAFGDASPGVPLAEAPFRQVIITGADGRDAAGGLTAALALLDAQRAPYQPAQVTTVHLADGQAGLRIDFAAPSPLGLLAGGAHT